MKLLNDVCKAISIALILGQAAPSSSFSSSEKGTHGLSNIDPKENYLPAKLPDIIMAPDHLERPIYKPSREKEGRRKSKRNFQKQESSVKRSNSPVAGAQKTTHKTKNIEQKKVTPQKKALDRNRRRLIFDEGNPYVINMTHNEELFLHRNHVTLRCIGPDYPNSEPPRRPLCLISQTELRAYLPKIDQYPNWLSLQVTESGQLFLGTAEVGEFYAVVATVELKCLRPFLSVAASCSDPAFPPDDYHVLMRFHVTGDPLVHHPQRPLVVNRQEAFKYTPNITGTVLEDQYQLENFKYPNGSSFPGVSADNTKSPPEIILNLPTFLNPKTYNISFDIFDTAQQLAFSAWQVFNITNRAPQQTLPTRTITFNGGTPGVDGIPSIVSDPDGDTFTLTIIPPNNTPPGLTFTKAVNLLFSTGFFIYDGAFLATNLTLNFLLKFIDPFNEELNINQTVKLIASATTTNAPPVTTFFNNTNNTNSSGNNNGAGAQTGSGGGGGGSIIPIAAAAGAGAIALVIIIALIIHKRRKNKTQPAHMGVFSRSPDSANRRINEDHIYAAPEGAEGVMFYGTNSHKGTEGSFTIYTAMAKKDALQMGEYNVDEVDTSVPRLPGIRTGQNQNTNQQEVGMAIMFNDNNELPGPLNPPDLPTRKTGTASVFLHSNHLNLGSSSDAGNPHLHLNSAELIGSDT